MIVGPTLLRSVKVKSSGGFLKSILTGKMKSVPHIKVSLVDVRDVAEAHFNAVVIEEAGNHRFILVAENMWFQTMA